VSEIVPVGGRIELDLYRPHPARLHDHFSGGHVNFTADREFAGRLVRAFPDIGFAVREQRFFLERAVRYLAFARGFGQFLVLGAGIPQSPDVREVARGADPRARVVYVEADPVACTIWQAVVAGDPGGSITVLTGDLAEPEPLLEAVAGAGALDLESPVAIVAASVLHRLSDEQQPARPIAGLAAVFAPGSALIVTHAASDLCAMEVEHAAAVCRLAGLPVHPRSRRQVEALFEGWELVDPGVSTPARWRPGGGSGCVESGGLYAGVAVGRELAKAPNPAVCREGRGASVTEPVPHQP
jgi:hypothetical protein